MASCRFPYFSLNINEIKNFIIEPNQMFFAPRSKLQIKHETALPSRIPIRVETTVTIMTPAQKVKEILVGNF
ncbi:hypothetical protein AUJ40_00745 [Candidatus Berkelbacteria bacterium CG1_02_42_45]|uniref:Uncharacterized protein n=1 Tax=Candidatus Berkelbacteria bacterium CG1_02_42_45 TaxID=1805036 RepID=A0A1J4RRM8_9BACT|nr:MAG: hypothetical protein AUJ40_00745 [Candidatus Berkelbacteria bacterium CG1_02_42_45]